MIPDILAVRACEASRSLVSSRRFSSVASPRMRKLGPLSRWTFPLVIVASAKRPSSPNTPLLADRESWAIRAPETSPSRLPCQRVQSPSPWILSETGLTVPMTWPKTPPAGARSSASTSKRFPSGSASSNSASRSPAAASALSVMSARPRRISALPASRPIRRLPPATVGSITNRSTVRLPMRMSKPGRIDPLTADGRNLGSR